MNSPESPRRLIGLAILWLLLALTAVLITDLSVTSILGRESVLGRGLSSVATAFAFYGVLSWAAIRRGRAVGGGDLRVAFGDGPIANPFIVAVIGVGACASVVLVVAAHYYGYLEASAVASTQEKSLWVHVFEACIMVLVAPVVEELWFRGWLWTGLRKHWSMAATAFLTAAFFVVVHAPATVWAPLQYALAAGIMTAAREVGGSIRASVAVHIIWNLTTVIATAAFVLWGGRG